MKRIDNIMLYSYEAEVSFTDGTACSFICEPDHDVSEAEVSEWMLDNGIHPYDIENHAYRFVNHFNLESLNS